MPPKPGKADELSSGEVAGVAVGATFAVGTVATYFWYRRRQRRALAEAAAKAGGDDPDDPQQQQKKSAGPPPPRPGEEPGAELPVPEGPRHEIDGVGKSAAAVRIELDGAVAFGPFELPATPAHAPARDLSWRTSESTFFHYTPKPTYALGEQSPTTETAAEARPPTQDSVSPLSPRTNGGNTLEPRSPWDGKVSPLTPAPLALPERKSFNGTVEEQAEWGNEQEQTSTLTNSEETEVLDSDKQKAWRRFGGGDGAG